MTVILKGASPSLYWVKNSTSGGLRCMIASYMTNNDYIFSWDFPYFNFRTEPFYCADFVAALNSIRNSGGFDTKRVYHVAAGAVPADDQYQGRYFVVAGRPLSSYAIQFARCQFTQNQNGANINIPQFPAPPTIGAIPNNFHYQETNVIRVYANTGRTKENALCQFLPYNLYTATLMPES